MNNRICIKIGSNVLTGKDGLPNESLIQNIVQQIASLMKSGRQVILVSSGAVAAGRSVFKSDKKLDTVAERQRDVELVAVARVVVDQFPVAFAEDGEIVRPMVMGKVD